MKGLRIKEFCSSCGENHSATRYLREFEKEYPDVTAEYFNMRFIDA